MSVDVDLFCGWYKNFYNKVVQDQEKHKFYNKIPDFVFIFFSIRLQLTINHYVIPPGILPTKFQLKNRINKW